MNNARVRELLIRFAEEAGKGSFLMYRKLWQLAHIEGGRRGMWLCPALSQLRRRQDD